MEIFLAVVALIGLFIFAVGALLWLIVKPVNPVNVILMVVGGLVFAVAQIIGLIVGLTT
jgi:hypothetical protein